MVKNLNISLEGNLTLNKKLISEIIKKLGKEFNLKIDNLELNFVSEETILDVNKKFLKHNYTTDIITFNYSDKSDRLDGEIFICPEVAVENAEKFDCSIDSEITRLIIHGILHLLGYYDMTEKEKIIMKGVEDSTVLKFNELLTNYSMEYDRKTS